MVACSSMQPSPSPLQSIIDEDEKRSRTTTTTTAHHHLISLLHAMFTTTFLFVLFSLFVLNNSSVIAFHQSRSSSPFPTRTDFSFKRMASSSSSIISSSTSLNMVRNRGLERIVEGATPLPGGMTLYIKPGPDGTSIGDCPFAHFVRIVLAEKNLDYDLVPCTPEKKPNWLVEEYGGKMPALRHRKECYVDSEVIVQYLDFFFKEPELSPPSSSSGKAAGSGGGEDEDAMACATKAVEGFFPVMAKYIKYRSSSTTNGDEEDMARRAVLEERLSALEDHLSNKSRRSEKEDGEEGDIGGPYIVGNGKQFTLLDCSLAPKLYALDVCLTEVKGWSTEELKMKYPHVRNYMDALFERPSFQKTVEYGKDTVVWGWTSDH